MMAKLRRPAESRIEIVTDLSIPPVRVRDLDRVLARLLLDLVERDEAEVKQEGKRAG